MQRFPPGSIIPLSEGSFTIDKTKLFIPFDKNSDDLQSRPTGSLLVEIQPFVVVTSNDIILLDTGLGFENAEKGEMELLANLAKKGIAPKDVTMVLLSHLHKDHAGGISSRNSKNTLCLPNATYYIQKRELRYAFSKGAPSYLPSELEVLTGNPRVHFLDEDSGSIGADIKYLVTGAHSPFHQVFWIHCSGKIIFFGGDVAPQLQQMKIRYKTKYDDDPDKALELRKLWWDQGIKEKWTFLFYHDIKNPLYPSL